MKLFGIMLVKDEADIVETVLRENKAFFDRIFVLDNGSTDGTWEIVQRLASETIVPWKQDFAEYSNSLRSTVFEAFRHESEPGDWWCYKMDADEIYAQNPRTFLSGVPRQYHTVFKRSIDYVITERDLHEHEFTGDFAVDREFLRYFRPVAYTEPRFFRYRRRLKWPKHENAPRRMGIPYPEPITVKHFQWRSPGQIQKRLEIRHQVRRDGAAGQFRHIRQTNWREVIEDDQHNVLDTDDLDYRTIPLRKTLKLPIAKYLVRRALHASQIFP